MSKRPVPQFDSNYFQHHCGSPYHRDIPGWREFFDRIAQALVTELAPASALDAGCAMGMLVESLRGRGVDAHGIDISDYAIAQVPPELAAYCRVGSVLDPLDRDYDLITCIEVLEHLAPEDVEGAIDNITAHTESIVFSSSPADYAEPTHQSVRPMEQWIELFARRDFYRDVDFDGSVIAPQALRLERRTRPTPVAVARDYERWHWRHRQEVDALRRTNLEAEETLGRLRREIGDHDQEVVDLRAELADRDQEVVHLRAELSLATGRATDAEAHLAAWRARKLVRPLAAIDAFVERIAPPGTRRRRLMGRGLGS